MGSRSEFARSDVRELFDFFFVDVDDSRDDFDFDRFDDELVGSGSKLVEFFLLDGFFFSDSRTLSIFGAGASCSRAGFVSNVGKSVNASRKAVDNRAMVVGVWPCLGSRIAWFISIRIAECPRFCIKSVTV